jgi:Flp pilus assembly protein TadB
VVTVTALAALLGVGTAAGLLMLVAGWRGGTPGPSWRRLRLPSDRATLARAAATAGFALLAGLATGWVVGALLAGMTAWFVPSVFGRDKAEAKRVAQIEAVATWTEMLRDTLAAAAGLEQAISVTAPLVPEAIAPQITALAERLSDGQPLAESLRVLGDELDDPTADLVVSALVSAAEHRAGRLGDLLGTLAAAAREQVTLRLKISAGRAQARTTVRITVAVTLLYGAGLTLLDRHYVAAFNDAQGQVVLLIVGALFTAGIAWQARIARIPEPGRFLTTTTDPQRPDPYAEVRGQSW